MKEVKVVYRKIGAKLPVKPGDDAKLERVITVSVPENMEESEMRQNAKRGTPVGYEFIEFV